MTNRPVEPFPKVLKEFHFFLLFRGVLNFNSILFVVMTDEATNVTMRILKSIFCKFVAFKLTFFLLDFFTQTQVVTQPSIPGVLVALLRQD